MWNDFRDGMINIMASAMIQIIKGIRKLLNPSKDQEGTI
jgi:hypothetical protein